MVAPKLKKYKLKQSVLGIVAKQTANRAKMGDTKYIPHFTKDGKKYYYKDLTDDIVEAIVGNNIENSSLFEVQSKDAPKPVKK